MTSIPPIHETTTTTTTEAVIEVRIPVCHLDDASRHAPECPICAHVFCPDGACFRSAATLTCCSQYTCCACFSRLLRRCRCTPECAQIVGDCPFCRDMCRADAKDIFVSRIRPCSKCKQR